MHELSVCRALIAQLAEVAQGHGAQGVKSVRVSIGPLSGVEPQLLRNAYPIVSAGSIAAESTLLIEAVPIRVKCETCGAETDAAPNCLLCGSCGDYHTRLLSGDELTLVSVELVM